MSGMAVDVVVVIGASGNRNVDKSSKGGAYRGISTAKIVFSSMSVNSMKNWDVHLIREE